MKYLLFLFPSICFAGDWTTADTAWQAAYTTVLAVDCAQTRYIASHHGKFHEENPVIPAYPTGGRVNNICLGSAVGHALVSYILPPDMRRIWQISFVSAEIVVINHNYQIGLKMEF